MHQIIFCTCPNRETAEKIAQSLVESNLAACVNILPSITSVYRWQGSIEMEPELLLLIKTRADCYATVEERIKSLHPYELPEIIAVSLDRGLPDYLKWIDTCLAMH